MMIGMNDLKTTSALVKSILEQDERCRNSDSFLYFKVLSVVAKEKNIDIVNMSVPCFLLQFHGVFFPPFETVRRNRQKIQAAHPELAACEVVQGFRAENEAQYRAYAGSEV